MTTKRSRPGAAHTEATHQMPYTRPQRKRLPKHRREKRVHERPCYRSPKPNQPIDWEPFLSAPPGPPIWLLYPLLERGQHALLFSETKAGKSLLTLDLVKRACEGLQLDEAGTQSLRVLYLDYENSADDIHIRLNDMEATPGQLADLVYIQFPDLPPLNTAPGGARFVELVRKYDVDLVVIDTISRALEGPENDSSTALNLYNHSLLPLKRMGVSSLRLDHSGADSRKGARGSSAKNSDVDAVWMLKYDKKKRRRTLIRTYSRRGRGPEALEFEVQTAPLRHLSDVAGGNTSAQIDRLCAVLDELGIPPTAGRPTVKEALKRAGHKASTAVLQEVVKQRQAMASPSVPKQRQATSN
ncbi:DNA helicase [Brachybacterium faecium]|nr:DNA helicase [Brachybacterium faecium]